MLRAPRYATLRHEDRISPAWLRGWQSARVAQRQHAAFIPLLDQMRQGHPREDFVAVARAVRMTGLADPVIIEVGCGSGWNAEVLSHLLRRPALRYVGLDYASPMIALGKGCYPESTFVVGDAVALPFRNGACDILLSGTVLMHVLGYREAIRESRRVARHWCIFHTVPVLQRRGTTVLRKKAYGRPVIELIFNEEELRGLLAAHHLVVRHVLESIPYNLAHVLGEPTVTRTYVCAVENGCDTST